MAKPEYLDRLIADASKAAGSDYALAKLLETTRQTVSGWKHDRKSCPVADQALMASIAGYNATEFAARALIAQHEGTPKGDKLYKALGKALVATGAVIATSGASAQAIFSSISDHAGTVSYLIRCILC